MFKVWPNSFLFFEILSIGVQAPGLDQGVSEMFRFVGPTPGNRPLLLKGDKKDVLRDIFNNREKKYKSLSKLNINTDNVDISDSCKTIMEYINE